MKRLLLTLFTVLVAVTSASFVVPPQDANALPGRATFDCTPHFKGGYYGSRCPPRKMHPEQDKYPGHSYHTIRVRLTIDDPSNVNNDAFNDTFYCDCGRGTIKCTIKADYDPPTGRTGRWIVGPTDASAGGGNDSSSTVTFRYQLDALDPYDLSAGVSKDRATVAPGGTITWTHSATRTSSGKPTENIQGTSLTQRKNAMSQSNTVDDTKTRLHAGQNNVQNSGLPEQVLLEGGTRERVCNFLGLFCTDRVKDPWPYRNVSGNVFASNSTRTTQSFNSTLVVGKDTPDGTEFCRQTVIDKAKYNGKTSYSSTSSPFACVTVKVDASTRYSLTPRVDMPTERVFEPSAGVTVKPTVTNNGPSQSRPTEWELTRIMLPPGVDLGAKANGGDSADAACGNYFRPVGGGGCSVVDRGAGNVFSRIGIAEKIKDVESQLEDQPIGTRFCFALSIKPPTNETASDAIWRHSKIECVKIGKLPKVQIHGGDLSVGRSFIGEVAAPFASIVNTSNVLRGGKTFGSWTEYAITAPGRIVNAGSSSGLAGGSEGTAQANWSKLTFANNSGFGEFDTISGTIPDISSAVRSLYDLDAAQKIRGNVQLNASTPKIQAADGDVVLSSDGTFGDINQASVIYAPGHTVRVSSNIIYTATTARTVKNIPQLVIIADNIDITNNVDRIDGWLIAQGSSGKINTCSDLVGNPSALSCNRQLTVNGPVAAKQLILRRTAGSTTGDDTARAAPAEVFNLRADAYLWALGIDSDSKRAVTTYTSELPPRF